LIDEIDNLVGKSGRSDVVEEAVRVALRRERLKTALANPPAPIDLLEHPEWSTPEKVSQWVHESRLRDDKRTDEKLIRFGHDR
jgi:hypothetical protein